MENEKRLDLIDRQALGIGRCNPDAFPLQNRGYVAGWNGVISLLEEAPRVDAVEVVHAHWEDGCAIHNGKEVYKSIDCSHCNEIFKTEDREYWKKRFKRCPFCGAMMDGGNEDDNKAST